MVRYRASCIGDGLPTNKQGEKMQRGGNPAKAVRLLFAPNIDKGCSRAASTSDLIKRRAVLAAVKTAPPYGGGLWPVLTAAARSAFQSSAGTEKPRSSRTEKLQKKFALEHLRLAMWLCDRTADQRAFASAAGHKPDQAIYPLHFGAHGRASDRVGVGRRSGFCFWGRAG